jgi:hypothetical protein
MAGAVVGSIETGVRLDRALTRASRSADGSAPRQAQAFGQMLHAADYAEWREKMLARTPGAMIAEVEDGCFGLILWMMRPTALRGALEERRMRELLTPPYVGVFDESVRADIAFGHTLASWLDAAPRLGALALAPPILETKEPDGRRRHFLLMLGADHYHHEEETPRPPRTRQPA